MGIADWSATSAAARFHPGAAAAWMSHDDVIRCSRKSDLCGVSWNHARVAQTADGYLLLGGGSGFGIRLDANDRTRCAHEVSQLHENNT
jgi:hypothetical protein